MFALGVGIISLLLHFEKYTQNQIVGNLAGIDLVAGAKGSPLQLIMSSVLHVDYPTGNISLEEANKLSKNPLVEKTIPIALGDNYKGFRIVGTTSGYAEQYLGQLRTGDWNKQVMEVTIGSSVADITGLKTGDKFAGAHGFIEEGHQHEDQKYLVTGILQSTGTVLDRLILTNVESVWHVHGTDEEHHAESENDHAHDHDHAEINDAIDQGREITALLVFYRNPRAAAILPREINQNTNMQAASPSIELNRLTSLLGFGFDALRILAWVIIVFSGINIMIHLLNKLNQDIHEIALLRSLGVGRVNILLLLIWQGIFLAISGWITGMILVRVAILIINTSTVTTVISIPLDLIDTEFTILVYAIGVGMLSTLVPAIRSYRTDIHYLLNQL